VRLKTTGLTVSKLIILITQGAHTHTFPHAPSLYYVSSLQRWCTLEVIEQVMKVVTCQPGWMPESVKSSPQMKLQKKNRNIQSQGTPLSILCSTRAYLCPYSAAQDLGMTPRILIHMVNVS
jgi:hypothetical protein